MAAGIAAAPTALSACGAHAAAPAKEPAWQVINQLPTFENVYKTLKSWKIRVLGDNAPWRRIGFPFCWKIIIFQSAPHEGDASWRLRSDYRQRSVVYA